MGRLIVELVNTTPLLAGWYRPELVDPQGIRTTEVKGLWRWWSRAFVCGALYDEGILTGSGSSDVLLRPARREVGGLVAELVGVELGLGLAVNGRSSASMFTVYSEPLGEVSSVDMRDSWQRIRLLSLGGRVVKGLPAGSRFRLYVEWRKEFKHLRTALQILLLALQLTGIGKGSRRGLGSLDVVSVRPQEEQLFGETRGLGDFLKEIYDDCLMMVRASEPVRRYVKERGTRSPPANEKRLPPMPVVSRSSVLGAPVAEVKVIRDVPPTRFMSVHNFFVRTERCRVMRGHPSCTDELRRNLAAWFLGLPRAQRRTGYFAGVDRRASPVMVSFHTSNNLFGGGAFLSTFLSGDWPKVIEWQGGRQGSKSIHVDYAAIVDAYRAFSKEFLDYLNKLGIGQRVERLWP